MKRNEINALYPRCWKKKLITDRSVLFSLHTQPSYIEVDSVCSDAVLFPYGRVHLHLPTDSDDESATTCTGNKQIETKVNAV